MSIKAFHKLFILASILLCGFFGYWAFNRYQTENTASLLATAIISMGCAVGLLMYGIYFIKKAKTL